MSLERLCREHAGNIAALIVEPIAGNMGVVPPADGFLAGLRALCDREGMVLIFDEVISGFRAALGGAQSIYPVRPDLTCLGKIIGGGLPVGAYGGRRELMELVAPVVLSIRRVRSQGNPLAMAAGLWSLGQLSKGLYTRLSRLGGLLAAGLADAARDAGVPLQVNAFGSVLTSFFTNGPVRDYRSAVAADARQYAVVFHAMLQRGIYPPVAIRGLVPVGRSHRARCAGDDQGGEGRDARRWRHESVTRVHHQAVYRRVFMPLCVFSRG